MCEGRRKVVDGRAVDADKGSGRNAAHEVVRRIACRGYDDDLGLGGAVAKEAGRGVKEVVSPDGVKDFEGHLLLL